MRYITCTKTSALEKLASAPRWKRSTAHCFSNISALSTLQVCIPTSAQVCSKLHSGLLHIKLLSLSSFGDSKVLVAKVLYEIKGLCTRKQYLLQGSVDTSIAHQNGTKLNANLLFTDVRCYLKHDIFLGSPTCSCRSFVSILCSSLQLSGY